MTVLLGAPRSVPYAGAQPSLRLPKRAPLSPGPQAAASAGDAVPVPVPPALPGETRPETRRCQDAGVLVHACTFWGCLHFPGHGTLR